MSRRAQRWLFITGGALIAIQFYAVREWLAALSLLAVIFAAVCALIVIGLVIHAAWQRVYAAGFAAWNASRAVAAHLVKFVHARESLVESNPHQ